METLDHHDTSETIEQEEESDSENHEWPLYHQMYIDFMHRMSERRNLPYKDAIAIVQKNLESDLYHTEYISKWWFDRLYIKWLHDENNIPIDLWNQFAVFWNDSWCRLMVIVENRMAEKKKWRKRVTKHDVVNIVEDYFREMSYFICGNWKIPTEEETHAYQRRWFTLLMEASREKTVQRYIGEVKEGKEKPFSLVSESFLEHIKKYSENRSGQAEVLFLSICFARETVIETLCSIFVEKSFLKRLFSWTNNHSRASDDIMKLLS